MSNSHSTTSSFHYNEKTGVVYRKLAFIGCPFHRVGDDGSVWSKWGQVWGGYKKGSIYGEVSKWKRLKGGVYPHTRYEYTVFSEDSKRFWFQVHRLVLLAFVGPCPEGMEACHNNGDRRDNRLENLRWDTRRKNIQDREKHGMTARGKRHGKSKLTEEDVVKIRHLFGKCGYTSRTLGRMFNVSYMTVYHAVVRNTWKHVV